MKLFKYIISSLLVFAVVLACTDEHDFENVDFLSSAEAPTNISALFDVTQDNTGLVTITPTAEGANTFEIIFGDGSQAETISSGENIEHTYAEGSYEVKIIAANATGKSAEVTQQLTVSFKAPENLEVVIENDAAVSKQVNVTANADYAINFDVYFGDAATEPITGNIGSTVSYVFEEAGLQNIRVVAKGAAIETTEYTEEFLVTEILQPIASAPTPPNRGAQDVISIYTSKYNNLAAVDPFPDWGQGGLGSSWAEFDLNGDTMLQYINITYQGIDFGEQIDASGMEYLHLDVWTTDVPELEVSAIRPGPDERPVTRPLTADEWTSIDIPLSEYTDQGLTLGDLFQLKLVGLPWQGGGSVFVDNIYFWKEPSGPSPLVGTWKLAPETGALGVGPNVGDYSWWFLNQWGDDVGTRACYMDDKYVFNEDGSFQNVLGGQTWLEPWQGVDPEACGTPIAPHDGTSPATWTSTETTITVTGVGAYLGLAKVHNTGEDGMPVGNTITYNYELTDGGNALEVTISGFGGGTETWYYKFVRESEPVNPIVGTWRIAPEDGALGVGPNVGDYSWWYLNQWGDDVGMRSCFMDDEYVFNEDGSFQNVLGGQTWLEPWQGVDPEACGTPIAPHDGTSSATWTTDGSTVTVTGVGAYLGLAKVHNTGEDGNPAGNTITYNYEISPDGNSMEVTISGFGGGTETWYYKFVKQ